MQYVPASAGFMTVLQQLRTCIETPKTNEWNKKHNINLSHLTLKSPYQGWTPRPVETLPAGRGGVPRPAPSCGEGGSPPRPAPLLKFRLLPRPTPPRGKKSFPVHPCFLSPIELLFLSSKLSFWPWRLPLSKSSQGVLAKRVAQLWEIYHWIFFMHKY